MAELCAHALCKLTGKEANGSFGHSYRYIEGYAEQLGMTPHAACLKVLSDTDKVLNIILKENRENNVPEYPYVESVIPPAEPAVMSP